jgi:hypothetical protein
MFEMIPQQQQQECGIPWYQSQVHKGGEARGCWIFWACIFEYAFPEAMMKKVLDSKQQQQALRMEYSVD